MEPSPLNFVSHTHYYRGGDVVVEASAAIAPGVVLRAAANASIRIGPGVCVGAGVVIQAKQGCVFIEAGASLGTGVLIVGQGHVGKDACVGPSSTLVNPAIAASEIIPPCSLIDAQSSQPAPAQKGAANATTQNSSSFNPSGFKASGFQAMSTPPSNPQASTFQSSSFQPTGGPVPSMPMPPRTSPTVQPQAVSPKAVNVPDLGTPASPNPSPHVSNGAETSAVVSQNQHVSGRDHVNSLLSALFPHRQPLNNENSGQYREVN